MVEILQIEIFALQIFVRISIRWYKDPRYKGTFTYYVSKIFGFLTPLPFLVSICQQQGPPGMLT